MNNSKFEDFYKLDTNYPVWDRFFMVHPLVIIGTLDENGDINLAPKHMVTPMGWSNYFGFMCTPNHTTYQNIIRDGYFTVSFPKPDQVLYASLSASPRENDDTKPALKALSTDLMDETGMPVLLNSYVFLECKHYKIYDDFDVNSLITGEIISGYVDKGALIHESVDQTDLVKDSPLLAYLNPRRFSVLHESQSFPFPKDFKK